MGFDQGIFFRLGHQIDAAVPFLQFAQVAAELFNLMLFEGQAQSS